MLYIQVCKTNTINKNSDIESFSIIFEELQWAGEAGDCRFLLPCVASEM